MTLAEFKAWFEGYTESMDSTPNAKQWERIKARVKDIDGTPVTPIVINDYWRPYGRRWDYDRWYATYDAPSTALAQTKNLFAAPAPDLSHIQSGNVTLSMTNAMYALGQADAESEAA